MNKAINIKKSLSITAWIGYSLIVFEILYMISPFAIYYYSIYKIPLDILQSNPLTLFLTYNLLPHFSYQTSWVISFIELFSIPLIVLGIIIFLVGFIQIYVAKFFKKGIVNGGIYKIIRHPQYIALAMIGLGCTIFWPRFIVLLMYATMIFFYYFLSKQEEKICIELYGEPYKKYIKHSGRFLPKIIEDKLNKFPRLLPKYGISRIIAIIGLYFVYIIIIINIGFLIKDFSLSKILMIPSDDRIIISVAPIDIEQIQTASNIALNDKNVIDKIKKLKLTKQLFYIAPSEWNIPELGLESNLINSNYISNPEMHGNSLIFNKDNLVLLISEPILKEKKVIGIEILKNTLGIVPYLEITIDIKHNTVTKIKDRSNIGTWDGIPVPVY